MTQNTAILPPVVAGHINAVNARDEDAIVATFAADALVNDARREFWGTEAIRRWVAREMTGDHVTIDVTEVIEHHGDVIVRGRYDGTFDKANLPAELILTNYFTVRDGKIVSLIVIRNTPQACLGRRVDQDFDTMQLPGDPTRLRRMARTSGCSCGSAVVRWPTSSCPRAGVPGGGPPRRRRSSGTSWAARARCGGARGSGRRRCRCGPAPACPSRRAPTSSSVPTATGRWRRWA